ncbi:MAG: glycosyltransferase family 2 protein [Candidatus Paceibacterota bacterium]|jgi:glycosyltransferase involved in cell wall biosynthesis
MKFSIITPTYKRADKLTRAVESVLNQTYTNWEMIIVNDSPDDVSYSSFENSISDPRIIYLNNEQNSGVNYSRNRALDNISKDSDWVIFLDDDDYFATDALTTLHDLIQNHLNNKWFVTNRAQSNGSSLTHFPASDTSYPYAWDYLITKKCKGDATHCISTSLIKNIRFSKHIKQAEEWLFFYQIGLREQMFYHNHNSTLTDGYNESSGLNFRKRTAPEQLKTLFAIKLEGFRHNLIWRPTFLIYLSLRFVRIGVKSLSFKP